MNWFASKSVRALLVIVSSALIVVFVATGLVQHANTAILKAEAKTESRSHMNFLQEDFVIHGGSPATELTQPEKQRLENRVRNIAHLADIRIYDMSGKEQFHWEDDETDHKKLGLRRVSSDLAQALHGTNIVRVENRNLNGRKRVFSNSYVPLKVNGHTVSVFQLRKDDTLKAETLTDIFQFLASMLVMFVFWISVALGLVFVNRIRKEEAVEQRARYLANYDEITGLYKRERFSEALENLTNPANRNDSQGNALYLISINDLAGLNDSLGIATGDALVKQIADDIKLNQSEQDFAARVETAQFAILRDNVSSQEDAEKFARQLVNTLKRPHELNGSPIPVSLSVGVKFSENKDLSADNLMRAAKLAMTGARVQGSIAYCLHTNELEEELIAQEELERDLCDAMSDMSQFVLHYQPQFHLSTGRLDGYETLVRWNHPTRGLVSPADFIPIAESAGLITALGAWILETACREASEWSNDVRIAVNISPLQLKNDDLVSRVSKTLEETGLDPARLELEVTETLFFDNPDKTIETLVALKALGVSVSMDDFGTGFSCLKHLWQFPFDKIKIDKSFVDNIQENPKVESIISSTIQLGRMLGMKITAEGVETKEQAAFLNGLDCDFVQGFLYGKPAPKTLPTEEDETSRAVADLKQILEQAKPRTKSEKPVMCADEFVANVLAKAAAAS